MPSGDSPIPFGCLRDRWREHERLPVLDPIDAVLQLLVRILSPVTQSEVVIRHIHRIVRRDGDVVRAAELLTVHAAGQHRVGAVLFQALHLAIVVGAPITRPWLSIPVQDGPISST